MTFAESGGIFVSYRRHESRDFAGRLSDHLAERFGEGQVFIDVDTIEPGVDFAEETAAEEPPADQGVSEPVDVLLVEDDPGDVPMTREAFEQHRIRNRLHVVTEGEQAIEFLRGADDFASASRAGLILLDLNLPAAAGLRCWRRSSATAS